MNLTDLAFYIFKWWFTISFLGLLIFPVIFCFFNNFKDKGWGLSKIAGIGFLAYWAWITGSLHLLPFVNLSLMLGILLLTLTSFSFYKKQKDSITRFIKLNWWFVLTSEVLFAAVLVIWSWIRAHQPDINGLEKFMDFGFVNSILRTRFFPPPDMWLTGETINYYYFGHLIAAVLSKLSGIPSDISYNLMIATIAALAFVAAFSFSVSFINLLIKEKRMNIKYLIIGGLISCLILVFAGNLHTIYKILTEGRKTYWYPDATRFIPFTIHEFPIYSFVVADLHGHVSDIPFVILSLSLFFNTFIEYTKTKKTIFSFPIIYKFILIGLLLAINYMTNALDGFIYLGLFSLILFIYHLSKYQLIQSIYRTAIFVSILITTAIIFSLPFHINFTPFTSGIAQVEARSSILQLLILWGLFIFEALLFFFLGLLNSYLRKEKQFLWEPSFLFAFGVISFSLFLIIVPEFVYIKDIYIKEYHRANTMFKLVYQTFILMSLMSGPVFISLLYSFKEKKKYKLLILIAGVIFTVGIGSVLIYPYYAINSYYAGLFKLKGLTGLNWMQTRYPDDYAAIIWINQNIEGQPVILEAVGESYTDFARVSTYTGLPTILGWRVHEWLWRGGFDEPRKRTKEVSDAYFLANIEETCRILTLYDVKYVFIGTLERQQYPNLNESKFNKIGNLIFSQNQSKIYSIKESCRIKL